MPSIAALHPQIVHFAIALLVAGVVLRFVALSRKFAWPGPAAAALLLAGTLAAVAAARSGADAHGPVERVPGARAAVIDHETWGERARNVFVVVAGLELVIIGLGALGPRATAAVRAVGVTSAVVGLAGLCVLYLASDRGGRLVYGYAGGVGIRSGDPADVGRLLVAGAWHQANLDREGGRPDEAAALIELVARRFPADVELQLAVVDSLTVDRRNPQAALDKLGSIQVPAGDARLRVRAGILRANALEAAGDVTAARQVLETLRTELPDNAQVQRRISELGAPRP
jgi:uncharacterized membrane protein